MHSLLINKHTKSIRVNGACHDGKVYTVEVCVMSLEGVLRYSLLNLASGSEMNSCGVI